MASDADRQRARALVENTQPPEALALAVAAAIAAARAEGLEQAKAAIRTRFVKWPSIVIDATKAIDGNLKEPGHE